MPPLDVLLPAHRSVHTLFRSKQQKGAFGARFMTPADRAGCDFRRLIVQMIPFFAWTGETRDTRHRARDGAVPGKPEIRAGNR